MYNKRAPPSKATPLYHPSASSPMQALLHSVVQVPHSVTQSTLPNARGKKPARARPRSAKTRILSPRLQETGVLHPHGLRRAPQHNAPTRPTANAHTHDLLKCAICRACYTRTFSSAQVYQLSATDGNACKGRCGPAPIQRLSGLQRIVRRPPFCRMRLPSAPAFPSTPAHVPPSAATKDDWMQANNPKRRRRGVGQARGRRTRLTGHDAPTARAPAAHPAAPPRRHAPGRTPHPPGRRRRRRCRRGARRLHAPASTVSAAPGWGWKKKHARASHAQAPRRQPFPGFRGDSMLHSRVLSCLLRALAQYLGEHVHASVHIRQT